MSKLEITTTSQGVTKIRDVTTGKSETIHLSGSHAARALNVSSESSAIAAYIFYRTDAAETA